jgi:hypothetical protein
MIDVPRYQRQIVCQCGGRDLFIDGVFWMRYSQSTPHLRVIVGELEDRVIELSQQMRIPLKSASDSEANRPAL